MVHLRDAMIKAGLSALSATGIARISPPGHDGRSAVLMLHRVTAADTSPLGVNSHLAITPDFLADVIETVGRSGYTIVSMDELADAMRAPGKGRIAAITLDDAYRDNLDEALPVFESYDAPFAVYVAPGLVDGRADIWWSVLEAVVAKRDYVTVPALGERIVHDCTTRQRKIRATHRIYKWLANEVPETAINSVVRGLAAEAAIDPVGLTSKAILDWDGIRTIGDHRLCTLGAHTIHHYNLARLAEKQVIQEMKRSAEAIRLETGETVRHFAFPFGGRNAAGPREFALARDAGFATAVTTRHGLLPGNRMACPHSIPRISINGRFQKSRYVGALLSGWPAYVFGSRFDAPEPDVSAMPRVSPST